MQIFIKASGMVTSVGFNSPATCAALRAGIRNVNETNLWDKYSGTYLSAGRVPLPQWWVGIEKLADLLAPAIFECFKVARPITPAEIPVLVGVASTERPFRLPKLDEELLKEVEHRLGFQLHPASHIISSDHVSVVVALREAGELMDTGKAPCCIISAVDSLVEHDLKNYYLEKRRLLTPDNSNGFSLGEAGSALLVMPVTNADEGELQVLGMGMAKEESPIESEDPFRGEGLTEAVRKAFAEAGLTIQETQYRIADLNGEHYKAKEMALIMGRFPRKPTAKLFDVWHPIEYIGDVGASIGPIVLGWALHAGQKCYGNGPTVLCTFGNDEGERAAMVVNYQSGEGNL